MTNTHRTAKLTNRNGNRSIWAEVTYHARHESGMGAHCGMSQKTIDAQDFRLNQITACGSNSDVNCPSCLARGVKVGADVVVF